MAHEMLMAHKVESIDPKAGILDVLTLLEQLLCSSVPVGMTLTEASELHGYLRVAHAQAQCAMGYFDLDTH